MKDPRLLPRPLRPDAAAAAAELHHQIARRPAWQVPCLAAADPAPWTSDDPAEAEWAAVECGGCPLLDACHEFARASRADGVVLAGRRWGGTTKTSPALAGATERTTA